MSKSRYNLNPSILSLEWIHLLGWNEFKTNDGKFHSNSSEWVGVGRWGWLIVSDQFIVTSGPFLYCNTPCAPKYPNINFLMQIHGHRRCDFPWYAVGARPAHTHIKYTGACGCMCFAMYSACTPTHMYMFQSACICMYTTQSTLYS